MMSYSGSKIALATLIDMIALVGIYKRQSWVIPLVTFFSCWRLVTSCLHVLGEKTADIRMLEVKGVYLIGALFCAYQIVVFTGKETKAYFSEKGQIIF